MPANFGNLQRMHPGCRHNLYRCLPKAMASVASGVFDMAERLHSIKDIAVSAFKNMAGNPVVIDKFEQ